jgi:hypothetical protein
MKRDGVERLTEAMCQLAAVCAGVDVTTDELLLEHLVGAADHVEAALQRAAELQAEPTKEAPQ